MTTADRVVDPGTTFGPAPTVPGSLGILGGTFDPIHIAHLAVAEEAREALGLERVLFIPAGRPPHKPGRPITAAEHRLAMVELAIAGNPAFAASRIELDRDGPSYTVDTLEALAADDARDLTLILSARRSLELPTWREPRRVLDLARLVVVPRDGYPGRPTRRSSTSTSRGRRHGWSSSTGRGCGCRRSELRTRAAGGRSLRYLVPGCGRRLYRRPCAVPTHQEG